MSTRESPKEEAASRAQASAALRSSARERTMRMPLPPPPMTALSITGKPMRTASA